MKHLRVADRGVEILPVRVVRWLQTPDERRVFYFENNDLQNNTNRAVGLMLLHHTRTDNRLRNPLAQHFPDRSVLHILGGNSAKGTKTITLWKVG